MGAWIETWLVAPLKTVLPRRTLTWVRGLKPVTFVVFVIRTGRTLTWVRGLKHPLIMALCLWVMTSHPYMGAWIETQMVLRCAANDCYGRTLTWVRGLKQYIERGWKHNERTCRTLTWVRGLKQKNTALMPGLPLSHPYMGAWIETENTIGIQYSNHCRTLTWVRGLKLLTCFCNGQNQHSRTLTWVRGLKLDICSGHLRHGPCRTLTWVRGLKRVLSRRTLSQTYVAPLHGCVD